ncbi:MAG TPA: glycerophosphodiester phosphodiesterase [Streptosporangiaceae bacterium]|nr:glycerophosphodiester phosphodiesterase [Streptosporangiaceae bacterium]
MVFAEQPAVVGHRGFGRDTSSGYRENTVESCLAAADAGLPWIEIDAQRTADDQLVLRHDWTAPDGSYIVDRTATELTGQGIALLADVLDAVPPEIGIDIDVKTVLADATDPKARRTGALVAAALSAESRRRRLLVTSFNPGLLVGLRPDLPGVAFGLLTWLYFPPQLGIPAVADLGLDVIGLHTASLRPVEQAASAPDTTGGDRHPFPAAAEAVAAAHEAGLDVIVWCPQPATVVHYAAAGADALVVDDVPGTLAAFAEQGHMSSWTVQRGCPREPSCRSSEADCIQ